MFATVNMELTSRSAPSTFSGQREDMRLPKLFSLQLLFMRRLQYSGLQKRWEIGKRRIYHKWNIFKGHQVHTLLANHFQTLPINCIKEVRHLQSEKITNTTVRKQKHIFITFKKLKTKAKSKIRFWLQKILNRLRIQETLEYWILNVKTLKLILKNRCVFMEKNCILYRRHNKTRNFEELHQEQCWDLNQLCQVSCVFQGRRKSCRKRHATKST